MEDNPSAAREPVQPEVVQPSPTPESDGGDGSESPQEQVTRPTKLIRIASMVRNMLEEVRRAPIDDAGRKALREANFPIMAPSQIAEAVFRIVTGGGTGDCWVCQPGREPEPYRFHDVPGPRTEGAQGRVPPGVREGTLDNG